MGNRPYGETFHLYADGCCLGNGKEGAVGGWGLYWEDQDLGRLAGQLENTTNNRAELTAISEALDMIRDSWWMMNTFYVHTDSEYAYYCINEWAPQWEEDGWKTADGKDVKNADLIKHIVEYMEQLDAGGYWVTVAWVKGHSGDPGNEEADKLAKAAARGEDWMSIGYE